MRRLFCLATVLVLPLAASPLDAQHSYSEPGATYDPRVPTPRAVLGYDLGQRFTTHRAMLRYVERMAATSRRVRVDTVARSFEGREMLLITISSEANMARLAELQAGARRIGDPRSAPVALVDAAVRQSPSIVWPFANRTVHVLHTHRPSRRLEYPR